MAHLSLHRHTRTPEETRLLGAAVARCCAGGEVFLLDGDLGAGKTCFTQGLAKGLEIESTVTSPTFVLHCQYAGRLELNHIDAYRLEGAPNLTGLAFDDLFGAPDNVTVIEWPQMIAEVLPRGSVHVLIHSWSDPAAAPVADATAASDPQAGSGREFVFEATHAPGYAFLERLSQALAGQFA